MNSRTSVPYPSQDEVHACHRVAPCRYRRGVDIRRGQPPCAGHHVQPGASATHRGVAGFHTDGQGDVGSTSLRDAVQARLPETYRTHETVQAVEVERVGMRKHLYLRDSRCICKAPNCQSASGEPRVCHRLPDAGRRDGCRGHGAGNLPALPGYTAGDDSLAQGVSDHHYYTPVHGSTATRTQEARALRRPLATGANSDLHVR
jgi:hypothetical protein